jgi:putative aldouronate transport system substrate-binding protein
MKKLLGILITGFALFAIVACTTVTTTTTTTTSSGTTTTTTTTITTTSQTATTASTIDYVTPVTVNVAINYTSGGQLMSISYQKDAAYQALDGKTYTKGSLLPAWAAIGEKLNIDFVDRATSSDANTNAQWTRLITEEFVGVDLVNATGAQIGTEGVKGNFVDIGQYLNYMPNLKAFLDANPSVKVSMTSADGGIYFTPYFDGLNELEQMFLARIDWIKDILDVETPTFDTDPATKPTAYDRRQVTTPINTNITVANADGTTRIVAKEYADNILDVLAAIDNPTGEKLANAFRAHILATYGDQGYAKLSDVFAGTDAAYDTDELLALMYVVKANPKYLTRQHTNGEKTAVEVLFPREGTGARIRNLLRGMEMFGLRGVFSRASEWLYFDEDGLIQDIRHEQRFVDGVNDLAAMYADGLIVQNPEGSTNWRSVLLNGANGFITYDYNASSTAASLINTGRGIDPDFEFQAILPPVVDWLGDGNYFHFSEAVRSVKSEAWGIPAHVADNETKLFRILKLVDEMYDYANVDSVGTMHLYGPEGWTDGTLNYGSDVVYKLSDEAIAEMNALAGGNMINYLRQYVGATMPIGHVRSLGLEFQTLSEEGIKGIERINTAVAAGVLKLAGLVDDPNPWYQLSPTFYPLTKTESDLITASATFRTIYTDNALITLVKNGFSGNGGSLTSEAYWASFKMGGIDVYELIYIKAYRDAYLRIQAAN